MESCKSCKSLLPPDPRDSIILFCPECGVNIFNLEQEVKKRHKNGIKKVSIKWQTFYSMIPFMPLVGAERIRKLRRGFIIYVIATALPLFAVLTFNAILDTYNTNIREQASSDPAVLESFSSFLTFYDDFWKQTFPYLLWVSVYLASSLVMVYFIRKWSMRWNEENALIQYLD